MGLLLPLLVSGCVTSFDIPLTELPKLKSSGRPTVRSTGGRTRELRANWQVKVVLDPPGTVTLPGSGISQARTLDETAFSGSDDFGITPTNAAPRQDVTWDGKPCAPFTPTPETLWLRKKSGCLVQEISLASITRLQVSHYWGPADSTIGYVVVGVLMGAALGVARYRREHRALGATASNAELATRLGS